MRATSRRRTTPGARNVGRRNGPVAAPPAARSATAGTLSASADISWPKPLTCKNACPGPLLPVAAPPVVPPPPAFAAPPVVPPPVLVAPPVVETPVAGAELAAVGSPLVGSLLVDVPAEEVAPLVGVPVVAPEVVPAGAEVPAMAAAALPEGTPKSGIPSPPPRGDARAVAAGGGRGWPTLTTMSPNSAGVPSRPIVLIGSWSDWGTNVGGAPSWPTGASRFWLRIAAATSSAVILRAAISCGSSQARML